MLNVYSDIDSVNNICLNEDDYGRWQETLSCNSKFIIDIKEKELDEIMDDDEHPLFMFYHEHQGHGTPKARHDLFEIIYADFNLIPQQLSKSILILDITVEQAKELSDKYGVIVLSKSKVKDLGFEYDFELPVIEEENVDKGLWEKFGELYKKQCSNSIIFNDRNLFSNESHGKNPGTENIIEILDNFLPEKLEVEFYVLIITEQYTDFNKLRKLKKGIKGVNERINDLRDYDIIVEVLTHHPLMNFYKYTHNRRILFNYHLGKVEHGLDLFSVSGELKGDHDDCFSLVSRFKNDSTLKQFNISLQRYVELKDDAEEKLKDPGQNDRHYRLLRNGEEVNTIENRLLN